MKTVCNSTPLSTEIDRLRAINAELIEALSYISKNCDALDWEEIRLIADGATLKATNANPL
jgi:hypothetical protein